MRNVPDPKITQKTDNKQPAHFKGTLMPGNRYLMNVEIQIIKHSNTYSLKIAAKLEGNHSRKKETSVIFQVEGAQDEKLSKGDKVKICESLGNRKRSFTYNLGPLNKEKVDNLILKFKKNQRTKNPATITSLKDLFEKAQMYDSLPSEKDIKL